MVKLQYKKTKLTAGWRTKISSVTGIVVIRFAFKKYISRSYINKPFDGTFTDDRDPRPGERNDRQNTILGYNVIQYYNIYYLIYKWKFKHTARGEYAFYSYNITVYRDNDLHAAWHTVPDDATLSSLRGKRLCYSYSKTF